MNEIWQGISSSHPPAFVLTTPVWLQFPAPQVPMEREILPGVSMASIWSWVEAIAILVVGIILAFALAALVKALLGRTQIDNRIARWLTGTADAAQSPPVEKWVAGFVFWVVMIFVVVAFLEKLQLTVVSQPLNQFLTTVINFLPRIGAAVALLGVAWLLATMVKALLSRGLRVLDLDRRLGQQVGDSSTDNPYLVTDTLANVLYWFIFLLFLPSVLSTLGLEGTLVPVQALLTSILEVLPRILAAIAWIAAGWVVASVVRRIVSNLLLATGIDRLGSRFGLAQGSNGQALSSLIGTIVYVLILIPFGIAALDALNIPAVTEPARAMLALILSAIPLIFTAGLVLAIAYVVGKLIADLVTNLLTSIGFNNLYYWLGLQRRPYSQPTTPPVTEPDVGYPLEQPTLLQPDRTKSPSEIAGIIVLVGIMLVAVFTAVDILGLEALTVILAGFLQIAGQALVGLIVFAVALYFANLCFNLIVSSGSRQARILGQVARVTIIILGSAMALRQMGIASDIVNLAFGLLLGAVAVAIALAFGLGGRDVAANQLREWLAAVKDDQLPD